MKQLLNMMEEATTEVSNLAKECEEFLKNADKLKKQETDQTEILNDLHFILGKLRAVSDSFSAKYVDGQMNECVNAILQDHEMHASLYAVISDLIYDAYALTEGF